MVVIIDHAGARTHQLDDPDMSDHLVHDIDRRHRDLAEANPADQRFSADIVSALELAARIVVIGHGNGQTDQAHHLIAFVDARHPALHAGTARQIRTDLPHMSMGALLALARDARATPTGPATLKPLWVLEQARQDAQRPPNLQR